MKKQDEALPCFGGRIFDDEENQENGDDETVSVSSVDSYVPPSIEKCKAVVPDQERFDNTILGDNSKDLAVTILIDRGQYNTKRGNEALRKKKEKSPEVKIDIRQMINGVYTKGGVRLSVEVLEALFTMQPYIQK